MLFSLTNPEVAIMMMGIFLFAVLLGFPIAFTLMAMGIGFGYYAYYDPAVMEHFSLTIEYFNYLSKILTQ
jgi:TRAP-type mannitol/chloroaromatic compound transport system permease large subunit